jgi:hypothetical protein
MSHADAVIKALKSTRWFTTTVTRWRGHCEACDRLGVESAPLDEFASDVLNTPEDKRDWLLTVEPVVNLEAFTRFRQYETPLQNEMPTGLFYRDYRKGKR